MSAYGDVKKAKQDVIAPELHSLQVEIKRLDSKIDSGFLRFDDKIDSVDDKIEITMQIRERLASVEAKVGALVH